MIDLKGLINFLPYQYKDQDTYIVDGKGILERFLEICGGYFQDNITEDIKNILEIIDIEKAPEIYLNYLWESFGQLPFAYGAIINEEGFKNYYNGLLSEQELKDLSSHWIMPKQPPFNLSTTQVRHLLQYSISLIKIRGTAKFFELLFLMYGLNCRIDDPTTGENYDGWFMTNPRYDQDNHYDINHYDREYSCQQCIPVVFHITGHNYSSRTEAFLQFRKAVENIIDLYIPYNVSFTVDYGFTVTDNYQISAVFQNPSINSVIKGQISSVPILVNVTSDRPNSTLKYQVSADGTNWGYKEYDSGEIYNAVLGDRTYYFRCVEDKEVVTQLYVGSKEMIVSYNISCSPVSAQITPDNPTVQVTVTANIYVNGKSTPVRVNRVGDSNSYISPHVYEFNSPGTYEFQITDYSVKKTSVVITSESNVYTVECNPPSGVITPENPSASTVITIRDLYGTENLQAQLEGSSRIFTNNSTFRTESPGTYIFSCTNTDGTQVKGVFRVEYQDTNFEYEVEVPGDEFRLPQEGGIDVDMYLIVTPKDDDSEVMIKTLDLYAGREDSSNLIGTLSGTIVSDANSTRILVTHNFTEDGYYTVKATGDTTKFVTFYISPSSVNPDEPNLYIIPANAGDSGWETQSWGTTTQEATYQLNGDNSCTFQISADKFSTGEFVKIRCQETSEEYELAGSDNTTNIITINSAGTYTYYGVDEAGDLSREDTKCVITVKDYPLIVEIKCEPETAVLDSTHSEVKCIVTCTSNKPLTEFDDTINLVGSELGQVSPWEFTTSDPGTYIFESRTDPSKRATFTVTMDWSVSPESLTWDANDTSEKVVTVNIPEGTSFTVEIEENGSN